MVVTNIRRQLMRPILANHLPYCSETAPVVRTVNHLLLLKQKSPHSSEFGDLKQSNEAEASSTTETISSQPSHPARS